VGAFAAMCEAGVKAICLLGGRVSDGAKLEGASQPRHDNGKAAKRVDKEVRHNVQG
jgi:hypothetical protein